MALKGHLISGGLVGPLAGIENGLANDLAGFDGSAVAGTRTLTNLLDAVIGDDLGTILKRGASEWEALGPADGYLNNAGGVVSWASLPPTTGRMIAGTPLVQNPLSLNTTTTQAHGLGAVPVHIECELECLTAEAGYSVGEVISDGNFKLNMSVTKDATNIEVVTQAAMGVTSKSGHAVFSITAANWKLTLTPYALS
jgi:hypothetical protein